MNAIDVQSIELVFGFDLHARSNRNKIVYDALLADSPLAGLVEPHDETLLDVQPFLGLAIDHDPTLQASLEIKTRTSPKSVATHAFDDEPLSIYLTVPAGPNVNSFPSIFGTLAGHASDWPSNGSSPASWCRCTNRSSVRRRTAHRHQSPVRQRAPQPFGRSKRNVDNHFVDR